jgi:hypothetical protein
VDGPVGGAGSGRLQAVAARQGSPDLRARVDPEDIVQSVFCSFFRGAADGRYDVPEGEAIRTLLLVMTLNEARRVGDFHRAGRRDIRRNAGGMLYDRAVGSASGRDETTPTIFGGGGGGDTVKVGKCEYAVLPGYGELLISAGRSNQNRSWSLTSPTARPWATCRTAAGTAGPSSSAGTYPTLSPSSAAPADGPRCRASPTSRKEPHRRQAWEVSRRLHHAVLLRHRVGVPTLELSSSPPTSLRG